MEKLVSEMICYVLSEMLDPAHSLSESFKSLVAAAAIATHYHVSDFV